MLTITDYIDGDLSADHPRRKIRDLSKDEWIQTYGSGTLRKSQKLGFSIDEAYFNERVKFEFGIGFEIVQRSRVAFNDVKLVPCQGMTELGWHAERMIQIRPFESDVFVCKLLDVDIEGQSRREGAGILLKSTSAKWIPAGYMVFSIVTQLVNGKYQPAINPF